MSRTHAGMAPQEYDVAPARPIADVVKSMEKGIFVQEVIRDKGLNVPVDEYLAFEAFLQQPDIDREIENDAEHPHHHSPGSASAYHDAMLKVAMEKFPIREANVNNLLVIRDAVYAYQNSAEIKQRVHDIIASDLMESAGVAVAKKPEPIEAGIAYPEEVIVMVGDEVVPDIVADVLGQLESEHAGELGPEDLDAYYRTNAMGRLAFWQDRIFPTDHLYARLRSVRSEPKHADQ